MKFRLSVLISGSGNNLQNIIDKSNAGILKSSVEIVIADRPCKGLKRAENQNIEKYCLKRTDKLCEDIDVLLKERKIDFIVLAGYLSILTPEFCKKWQNKIINLHPSLLPKYGGMNMYGDKVHQAVLKNKEKESGATVHFVNEIVDGGRLIVQEKCLIDFNETVPTLKKKVQRIERRLLIEAIQLLENK